MLECRDVAVGGPERQIFGVKAVAFKRHKYEKRAARARIRYVVGGGVSHERTRLCCNSLYQGIPQGICAKAFCPLSVRNG